jgi:hypothetical protein
MTPQEFYAMSPLERVMVAFEFPPHMVPEPHQVNSLNTYGEEDVYGCWDKPGTGKTFTATLHACLGMCHGTHKQWVVLMPPVIIPNWARWLRSVKIRASGQPLTVLEYRGTPAQRQKMEFNAHFTLMSYEIFKKDFGRLTDYFLNADHGVGLICDEAHKCKNRATANYKHVKAWKDEGVAVKMLTGTPAANPADVFTYTRLKNPEAYRNWKHFCDLHVEAEDEYEKVIAWRNLDLAHENLMVRSTMTRLEDIKTRVKPSFDPWLYTLAPAHQKLYDQLAEEQVLEIEATGEEVTALNASALFTKCQQIVLNLAHFSGDETATPAGLELAEQWLDELGDGKLIIVAHYRMSNEYLFRALAAYNPAIAYGGNTFAQTQANIQKFISDPTCRVIVMQPEAGGVGVDGLQHVCNSMLLLEYSTAARHFEQVVARIDRTGQTRPVQVRIAVAEKTVQASRYHLLLKNEGLVSDLEASPQSLRDMIHGVAR